MTSKQCKCWGASAFGLMLAFGAAGCGSSQPVAGITNPNPGSVVDRDKAAIRTDINVPDENAGKSEPVAEAASSSPSGTGTTAGTAGGHPAADSDSRETSPESASSPPATPADKSNSGEASGGTKPSGPIKEGTPRSPQ